MGNRAHNRRGPQAKEKDIIEYLEANGYHAWRNQSGTVRVKGGAVMRLAPKGTADVIGFNKINGLIVAIERKQPGEEISDDQQDFIDTVKAAGGYAGIATCLEDVAEILDK